MQSKNHDLKKGSSRTIAISMWLIASIFYAYQYILRVMPNIMMHDVVQQFGFDAKTYGQYSGVYYIGYSLMHLPVGLMLDRFGPKKIMPLCILMTVVGLLPIVFSDFWLYPIIGRALIGMGSSAAILGTFKIIRLSFAEEKFTRMLSISVMIGLVGAIYGGGPLEYMCKNIGYKNVAMIFVLIGMLLSVVTYALIPNIKQKHATSVNSDIKEVFCNKKVWLICVCAGLMVGPLEGFADVWGTSFLQQVYGLDRVIAASLPSAIFVGMCFGSPLLSLIAEKTRNYYGTIIGAGIIMSLVFILLLVANISIGNISLMFSLVGVCSAYQIAAIYKASTYVKEHVVGLTTAAANMIIMSFGYLFHSIIGLVINVNGGTNNSEAFILGVSVVPIALILGVIGFIAIVLTEKNK